MGKGFVPEGDKIHQLMPQRPGAFIAVTEQGRIYELIAFMDSQTLSAREWENVPWVDAEVEAENARVKVKMEQVQMHQTQGGQQRQQRAPSGIIQPGQVARPGTI